MILLHRLVFACLFWPCAAETSKPLQCVTVYTLCGEPQCPDGMEKLAEHTCEKGLLSTTVQASCVMCPSTLRDVTKQRCVEDAKQDLVMQLEWWQSLPGVSSKLAFTVMVLAAGLVLWGMLLPLERQRQELKVLRAEMHALQREGKRLTTEAQEARLAKAEALEEMESLKRKVETRAGLEAAIRECLGQLDSAAVQAAVNFAERTNQQQQHVEQLVTEVRQGFAMLQEGQKDVLHAAHKSLAETSQASMKEMAGVAKEMSGLAKGQVQAQKEGMAFGMDFVLAKLGLQQGPTSAPSLSHPGPQRSMINDRRGGPLHTRD